MPLNPRHTKARSPKSSPHGVVESATALQGALLGQNFARIRDNAWELHSLAAGLSRQSETFNAHYPMQSVEAMFDLAESIECTLLAILALIQHDTPTGDSRFMAETFQLQAELVGLRNLLAPRECCDSSKVCTHSTDLPSVKNITEEET